MNKAINLIFKFRQVILFLSLELICLKINSLYRFHNKEILLLEIMMINKINDKITEVKNTFFVNKINKLLIEENRRLRLNLLKCDTSCLKDINRPDNHTLLAANVINNSIIYLKNFITINKGSNDGIEPGMGVFCSTGIVGRVNKVSENFSTIFSILHVDLWTSAEIKNTGVIGSIRWLGKDYSKVKLMYIPIYAVINIGDEVTTSGYGDSFFKGIPIGKISHIEMRQNEAFYNIDIDLCTDLSSVKQVYIVKDNRLSEKIKLEEDTIAEPSMISTSK